MKTVSVMGYGQIGGAFMRGLPDLAGWQIGAVLTRHPVAGVAGHTKDIKAFLSHPADLIVDAAGPRALRALGPEALAVAPVWSVGAVAMADPAFRAQITSVSRTSGHRLRLFACGMADMPLSARRLQITMRGPEIAKDWSGPLSEAIGLWPDHLNTAVATALNGPGLASTRLVMERGQANKPHQIEAEAEGGGIAWHRCIRFETGPGTRHPVAQMLLSELARTDRGWRSV